MFKSTIDFTFKGLIFFLWVATTGEAQGENDETDLSVRDVIESSKDDKNEDDKDRCDFILTWFLLVGQASLKSFQFVCLLSKFMRSVCVDTVLKIAMFVFFF